MRNKTKQQQKRKSWGIEIVQKVERNFKMLQLVCPEG